MEKHFYTPLTEGDFGNGRPLRQSLVEGSFWPCPQGGYALYCGVGHVAHLDAQTVVCFQTGPGPLTVPDHAAPLPGQSTLYLARRVSGTGKQEWGHLALVELSLDAQGHVLPPRPHAVSGLAARALSGRVQLSWWYASLGAQMPPRHFEVFSDAGSGAIDWEQIVTLAPYRGPGGYVCDVTLDAPQHDRYRFAIRAAPHLYCGGQAGAARGVRVTVRQTVSESLSRVSASAAL